MRSGRRLTLIYDGDCRFCIRSLAVLKRLDWLDLLELVPSSAVPFDKRLLRLLTDADFGVAMYAVSMNGRTYSGFDAFRQAFLRLPLGLFIVWACYLPGAKWLGSRCYAWIARRRGGFGCAGTCEI